MHGTNVYLVKFRTVKICVKHLSFMGKFSASIFTEMLCWERIFRVNMVLLSIMITIKKNLEWNVYSCKRYTEIKRSIIRLFTWQKWLSVKTWYLRPGATYFTHPFTIIQSILWAELIKMCISTWALFITVTRYFHNNKLGPPPLTRWRQKREHTDRQTGYGKMFDGILTEKSVWFWFWFWFWLLTGSQQVIHWIGIIMLVTIL